MWAAQKKTWKVATMLRLLWGKTSVVCGKEKNKIKKKFVGINKTQQLRTVDTFSLHLFLPIVKTTFIYIFLIHWILLALTHRNLHNFKSQFLLRVQRKLNLMISKWLSRKEEKKIVSTDTHFSNTILAISRDFQGLVIFL